MRNQLIPTLAKTGKNFKTRNKDSYDGIVLNIICQKNDYVLVRANTYTYQCIDADNCTFSRISNGTELCVRDNNYTMNRRIIEKE